MDQPEPVSIQAQLVQNLGSQAAQPMCADVAPEAGRELLGRRRAARPVAAFQDQHVQPGPGQQAGGHQAVVARADHHDVPAVGRHRHVSSRMVRAASRPGPPEMPPPGCAPDPHR